MTTKEDFLLIIDQEEGELLVSSLIEEILQRSHDVLFEKHIESQVLPYAVEFAKETVVGIVEWEFFKRDPGDIDPLTWEPDEEPHPVPIDSWARGAIPVRKAPATVPAKHEKKPITVAAAPSETSLNLDETESILSNRQRLSGLPADAMEGGGVMELRRFEEKSLGMTDQKVKFTQLPGFSARPSVSQPMKASAASLTSKKTSMPSLSLSSSASRTIRKSYRPPSSRRHTFGDGTRQGEAPLSAVQVAEMAIQEENKRTLARIHGTEKEGARAEIGFDSEGRVIPVKRVIPGKGGVQSIKTRILTTDAPSPPPQPQQPTKGGKSATSLTSQQHLQRTHQHTKPAVPLAAEPTVRSSRAVFGTKKTGGKDREGAGGGGQGFGYLGGAGGGQGVGGSTTGYVEDTSLDIPLLADTMKVVAGVTLKEGEIIKRGPMGGKKQKEISPPLRNALHTYTHSPTNAPHPSRPRRSEVSSSDPLLDQVLSKARPVLKPVPFPVGGTGLSDAYARLPGINESSDHSSPISTSNPAAANSIKHNTNAIKRAVAT
ncbi:hypothetical protein HDV00_011051 [Rhizophlyctis rosea]|nr:hypothetical protein HDV00_011051 [Rhizophlyctis rosea]